MPMILALEACACRMKEDRSGVAKGGRTAVIYYHLAIDDGACSKATGIATYFS